MYALSDVVATTSPSMDIQVSSNFERFLFEAAGRDAAFVRGKMNGLRQSRSIGLGEVIVPYRESLRRRARRSGRRRRLHPAGEGGERLSARPPQRLRASLPRARRSRRRPGTSRTSRLPPRIPPSSPTPSQAITGERPALPPRLAPLMSATRNASPCCPTISPPSSASSRSAPRNQARSRRMSTQVTRLANGLRVVSHHMPHVETVSLGVWVAAGARHEREAEHGISHLLEHMAFKGTERRSASDIAEEIEAVGGELNAATSLETTAYFARTLKADIGHRARYPGRHPADPALRRGRARARARGDPAGDRRHPRQPRRDRLRAAAGRGLPRAGDRPPHPRHHQERQELRRRRPAHVPAGQLRRQAHGAVGGRQRRSRRARAPR